MKFITGDLFDQIREKEYPEVTLKSAEKKEILQILNDYFSRMILSAKTVNGINLNTVIFAHCNGYMGRHNFSALPPERRDIFNPSEIDEDDEKYLFELYTVSKIRKIFTEYVRGGQVTGIQSHANGISTVAWFNWMIYYLVTTVLQALKTTKFKELLHDKQVSSFFNPKYHIEKYFVLPKFVEDCEDLYTVFEMVTSNENGKEIIGKNEPILLKEIPVTKYGYFLFNFLLNFGYLYKQRSGVSQSYLLYTGLKKFMNTFDL